MSLARRTLAALAVVGASLSWSAAAHAQAVVIRSTGPSAAAYPMGRKLPAGAVVTLKAGDQVTVIVPAVAAMSTELPSAPIGEAMLSDPVAGSTAVTTYW
jgi:hypothetical protein